MSEAIGLLIGILTLVITFKPIFGGSKGFKESLGYWLKPDLLSFMHGEYQRDMMAEARLGIWLVVAFCSGFFATMVAYSIF